MVELNKKGTEGEGEVDNEVPEHIKLGAIDEVSNKLTKQQHTYTTMMTLLVVVVILMLIAVMLIYTRCRVI